MSEETLRQALEFVLLNPHAADEMTITWHAGEPLCVPQAFYEDALQIAADITALRQRHEGKVQHSIQTNGTLISDSWCQLFLRNSIHVGVSLDGPRELHDSRRRTRAGSGTFDKVIAGVRLLLNSGVDFSVITVLSPEALDRPDVLYEFYKLNGIRKVGFNIDEITGSNRNSSVGRRESEMRYVRFMTRIMQRIESDDEPLQVRDFLRYEKLIVNGPKEPVNQLCKPFAVLSIAYDGQFSTFCPELLSSRSDCYPDGFSLGNVFTETIDQSIQTPKFLRMWSEISAGIQKCRSTCQYFSLCRGGAPSNKMFEIGTFDAEETSFCRFTHMKVADVVMASLERKLNIASDTSG
jgi:uncharacterized protein